jgi:hypothetical protein
MKRLVVLLALLPQCTGCLYYAYPTISTTPDLTVPNPDGSVHAFRVDVEQTTRPPAHAKREYTLMRIPIDQRGLIPGQLEVAHAAGVWNPLGFGDTKEHERSTYTMLVRFYRPGYQTREVQSWDKARHIDWVEARDLSAQERAVDNLLTLPISSGMVQWTPATGPQTWWDYKEIAATHKEVPFGLQPGITSPSHRAALVFAATEYDRLANSPMASGVNMQPVRERLRAKADWLRVFSETAPPR